MATPRPLLLIGFQDRTSEREALVAAHVQYLTAILGALAAAPDAPVMRKECSRFLDESLWSVTEIRPSLKFDTRFISEGMHDRVVAFNKAPTVSNPLREGNHEHVVPLAQLRARLTAAGPLPSEIEAILRMARGCVVTRTEHALLSRHDHHPCLAWERYALAAVRVWDRTTGTWVTT